MRKKVSETSNLKGFFTGRFNFKQLQKTSNNKNIHNGKDTNLVAILIFLLIL